MALFRGSAKAEADPSRNEQVLQQAINACTAVARGDTEARITGVEGDDRLAELCRAINRVLDVTDGYVRESATSVRSIAAGDGFRPMPEEGMQGAFVAAVRAINGAAEAVVAGQGEAGGGAESERLRALAASFGDASRNVVESIRASAATLQASATALADKTAAGGERTATLAGAAEDAATNVQAMASAGEQLSGSIEEIKRQVAQASAIASEAVAEAQATNANIASLSEAADKIGQVLQLITDIAGQTNLLALNATIEAARAGDAGKGFAVVASEVKNLANQTAKATDEIGDQIGGIQQATQRAVGAVGGIGGTIERLDQIAASIAAAVDEQAAATAEIARSVEQAAGGTRNVTDTIGELSSGAGEAGHAAREVLGAATELARQADALAAELDGFMGAVRDGD